ncbi:diguanylate cyclase [Robertmurraya andreesenii]|uniref:Diguanylate cyclase (GGDEF)-like protein n=1 Tax=Anoxybacillus andreesenii TaxID=1325932 RepID=A0ABT9V1F2_9BACL|nr:diguanylate cyclase [Robertmurraya andreesenii]MDQ0154780.1 diguanylate cyclase (GGDEF)-like protein [Robertmurraya andreesenii]
MNVNFPGKLGKRLLTSMIVSTVVIVIVVIVSTYGVRYFLNVNIQGQRALDSIEGSTNELFKALIDQETGQRGYNLTKDVSFLEPYNKGVSAFSESSEALLQKTTAFSKLDEEAKKVIELGHYWQEHYGELLVDQAEEGKEPNVEFMFEGKQAIDHFRIEVDKLAEQIEAERSIVRNSMQMRINATLGTLMFLLIGIVLINLWINFRLLKSVIRPIVELSRSVKHYTNHDFSQPIPSYQKEDELFELVQNVDLMRKELSNSIHTLEQKVNFDELTGLYNRRFFNEFMVREWESAMEYAEPFSLIICDIDHYKSYNDTFGHLAGDECLRTISKLLQSYNHDPLNLAARYGGEEFAIILLLRTEEEALVVAEEIRKGIEDLQIPHPASPTSSYVTVSLGVATIVPTESMVPNNIIQLADEAMYKSKQNGRNRVTAAHLLNV